MTALRIPRLFSLILALMGGIVCEFAFPGFDLWFLAPVALALLALATLRDAPMWNLLLGFVWGMGFFVPHIHWAEYAVGGPLPWIALSSIQALVIGCFSWTWTHARRLPIVKNNLFVAAFAFSVLWVGFESLRSNYPWGGFPWGRLAYSQSESLIGRLAWLGGAPLVSLAVAAIGLFVAIAALSLIRMDIWRLGLSTATSTAIVVSGFIVPISAAHSGETLHVGAVQGNVSKPGADAFSNRQEVLNNHVAGTHALAQTNALMDEPLGFDIVVWPENGSDIDPRVDENAAEIIDQAAQAVDAPILVGTQEYLAEGGRLNLSALWEPGVGITATYAKQKPVPFGEYIPEREFFAKIYPDVSRIGIDMIAGTEPAAMPVNITRLGRDVIVGPVICFEVGVDSVVHGAVQNGAEVLFVQTNNASFGHTNESIQQLAMSRLRAIETNRAVVHVSTVGVSAIYLPNGVEIAKTGHFTAEQMMAEIPLETTQTPAVKFGQWPTYLIWAGSVLLLVGGLFSRKSSRSVD